MILANLVEDCPQLLQGKDPQCVGCNGYDALRALLGGEAGCILEQFVREGSEVEAGLVPVAEPRTTGHRKDLMEREKMTMRVGRMEKFNGALKRKEM